MVIKPFCIVVCGMLLMTAVRTQNCMPIPGFWGDFSGTAGGKPIELSVYRDTSGRLTGNCRYGTGKRTVWPVTGTIEGCSFTARLLNPPNHTAASLNFRFYYDAAKKEDHYSGSFTDSANNNTILQLRLNSMVGGTAAQRYNELFGTTGEVEAFAEKIKNAFTGNDKKWLAANCQYPLTVYIQKGKPRVLHHAKEFESQFDLLFTKAYRDKFAAMKCYNMFSNHVGAMMGNGEIKINHTRTSVKDNYTYCITGIEVFM